MSLAGPHRRSCSPSYQPQPTIALPTARPPDRSTAWQAAWAALPNNPLGAERAGLVERIAEPVLLDLQVMPRLQVDPELLGRAEETCQPLAAPEAEAAEVGAELEGLGDTDRLA